MYRMTDPTLAGAGDEIDGNRDGAAVLAAGCEARTAITATIAPLAIRKACKARILPTYIFAKHPPEASEKERKSPRKPRIFPLR
jgi:hypothetical protein